MNLRYVMLFAALPLSNALAAPLPIPPSPPAYDAQRTETFWNKISTSDPQYTRLLLQPTGDTNAYIYQDIDNAGSTAIFKSIFLDGSSAASKPTYTLNSVISETNLKENPFEKTFSTSELSLKDVKFISKARIKFVGTSNNTIRLDNSEIQFDSFFRDAFPPGSSFLIEGANGTSTVTDFYTSDEDVKVDSTIRVLSGAKLIYGEEGTYTNFSTVYRYDGNFLLDLKANSEFELYYYKLRSDQGVVNMANGSTFTLTGTDASISVKDMNLDGARYIAGVNNETSVSGTLSLDDSSITLGRSHNLEVGTLSLAGTSSLTGESPNNTRALIDRVQAADANASSMEFSQINANIETLDVASNLTIDLAQGADLYVDHLVMDGGTVNVKDFLVLQKSVTQNSGMIVLDQGSLEVQGTAMFDVSAGGFNLNTGGVTTTDGGTLLGSGTLAGNGGLRFEGDDNPGLLSIGGAGSIATLTTDAEIAFYEGQVFQGKAVLDRIAGGLDGGGMQIDVGVDNLGFEQNDVLEYGVGNVDIAQIKTIEVDVVGAPSPADLDGKIFDIVNFAPGATGSIRIFGQDLNERLVEGPNVPVLIDFELTWDGPFVDTNSGCEVPTSAIPDCVSTLTIVAKEADNIALSRNPNLRARNHRKVAALVPVTVPTLPTNPTATQVAQHTVATAMQTLTNQNVAQDFTSVNPEVVASSMTVQIEQADQMLNTLLSVNSFSSGSNAEDALASGFLGGIETGQNGVWGNVSYIDGKIDGQQDLGDFNYYLSGVSLGSTFFNRGETYLGSFFSVNQQTMSGHELASSNFKGDGYHLGVYGGLELSPSYQLNWVWGHGWNSTKYDRIARLNTIAEQAKGEFDSDIDYLGFRVMRDTSWLHDVESNIFTGLAYLRSEQEAYSETNATNLGLTFDKSISHALVASLGVNAKRELSEQTRAHVLVRYDYDIEADDSSEHTVNAAFTHTPDTRIGFIGQNRGAHTLSLGLGVGHEIAEDLDVSLAGLYAHSDHGREIGGEATLNWAF